MDHYFFNSGTRADIHDLSFPNLPGLDVELVHVPGETRDQMAVVIPDFGDRLLLACGDNYYHMFPNLYPIRGSPPRPILEWAESIRTLRLRNAEILLPGHTRPIIGADVVYEREDNKIRRSIAVYLSNAQWPHLFTKSMGFKSNAL